MTILALFILLASGFGPLYAITMGTVVRRFSPTRLKEPRDTNQPVTLAEIVMVPCLNEGLVVAETIRKLHLVDPNLLVVVVDDGSDDNTAQILSKIRSNRVVVVTRRTPNCRQGKGEALNHGYRVINNVVTDLGLSPDQVIVAVFDADGFADAETLDAVRPWFLDPAVGAVQIAVRINNRFTSILARLQDIEFSGYTEIYQYGRNAITSTGLGGNGQFARLSALRSLGDAPWSDCLTEDLDLGIRLRLGGWRTVFDGSVAVHQQGLHSLQQLINQRTRWFQGHLQLWSLLPSIWRSAIPRPAKFDISLHLVFPVMTLLISVGILASLVKIGRFVAVASFNEIGNAFLAGPLLPWWYILGFAATPLLAAAYWKTEPTFGFWRGLLYAHLYTFYTWIWFAAGWRAVWRELQASDNWSKTARVAEPESLNPNPQPPLDSSPFETYI